MGFVRYGLLDNIEKHIGAKVFMVDAEMELNKLKQASTSNTQSSKSVCVWINTSGINNHFGDAFVSNEEGPGQPKIMGNMKISKDRT